jgi:hypothetical protein
MSVCVCVCVCVCECRQCTASPAACNLKYNDYALLLYVFVDKCNHFSLLLVQEVKEYGGLKI